jgi:hypothetical protein
MLGTIINLCFFVETHYADYFINCLDFRREMVGEMSSLPSSSTVQPPTFCWYCHNTLSLPIHPFPPSTTRSPRPLVLQVVLASGKNSYDGLLHAQRPQSKQGREKVVWRFLKWFSPPCEPACSSPSCWPWVSRTSSQPISWYSLTGKGCIGGSVLWQISAKG